MRCLESLTIDIKQTKQIQTQTTLKLILYIVTFLFYYVLDSTINENIKSKITRVKFFKLIKVQIKRNQSTMILDKDEILTYPLFKNICKTRICRSFNNLNKI